MADSDSPLIYQASENWNGDFSDHRPEIYTTVNLEVFGDLVEEVYIKIQALHRNSNFKIRLRGGAAELLAKYSYAIVNPEKFIE